ncbi:MAG: chalcone isomerase family protein [Myxococcota bacterium]
MLLAALLALADAATLAGVTLPDTATVGGQTVRLNGIGLREKFYVDVYVGGLYLTHPTKDGTAAIDADEPKRVVMHFVYSKVTRDQLVESFVSDFGHDPASARHKADIDRLIAVLPAQVVAGEELVFDYVPGQGTTFRVGGKPAVTIAGVDFMKMIWNVWLGPNPPTADIKKGMLGL